VALVVKLIASGDIADYTPTIEAAIAQNFAIAAGVPFDSVQVNVASASVAISVIIMVPEDGTSAKNVSNVHSKFVRLLGTPHDATQFFSSIADGSISITSIDEPPHVLAPPSPPFSLAKSLSLAIDTSAHAGTGGAAVIGIVAGVAVFIICAIAVILIRKKRMATMRFLQVERKVRSVSIATLNAKPAGMETKLVGPRIEVLSDQI